MITVFFCVSTLLNYLSFHYLKSPMKILQLISLHQHILLVFSTSDYLFQFSIIAPDGFVSTSSELFPSLHHAEQEGRFAISLNNSFFDENIFSEP